MQYPDPNGNPHTSPAIPETMRAVRVHQRGGPDVLQLEEIPTPRPGPGQVLIRVATAGVNMADVGQRSGQYPNLGELPLTLGYEVAGMVTLVGEGVRFPQSL